MWQWLKEQLFSKAQSQSADVSPGFATAQNGKGEHAARMPTAGRREPLRIVPFAVEKPRTFNALLCDGVAVHGLTSLDELLTVVGDLQNRNPDASILASLDNLGQAAYTSGHTTDKNDLNNIDGHDLSGLDSACFEEGEHLGYLSTPAEFPIRLANFLGQTKPFDAANFASVLPWATDDGANDLVTVNRSPDRALQLTLDKFAVVQIVPVALAADALAAFPNGYFMGDLQPDDNHGLASHLEAKFGLVLFGVGARFLGFRRDQALSPEEALALAGELVAIYEDPPVSAVSDLAMILSGRNWVLLRYTEN